MRPRLLAALLLAGSTAACEDDPSFSSVKPPDPDPGALVEVHLEAQVGVLLDELPSGAVRDRAAEGLLGKPADFWRARAARQIEHMTYRLVFRPVFNQPEDPEEAPTKRQLPLPPAEGWTIEPGEVTRTMVDGHDAVVAAYTLDTTIVTGLDQPGLADPDLEEVGGTLEEAFVLPLDPELLFQRTGFACMDEADFPPGSVDGENASTFYDDACEVERPESETCHLSEYPQESCVDALAAHVGRVDAALHFEHVEWDEAKAEAARIGEAPDVDGADLEVVGEALADNRVIYRYIPEDSCAVAEGCVGGTGWRRLLQFTSSVKNVGARALSIGDVDYYVEHPTMPTPLGSHNIFEPSECHGHYHFSHYAEQSFAGEKGQKRAFCLQSTQRYANHEASPLVNDYGTCEVQGIEAGWGDDYIAGLDCQWIDITGTGSAPGPTSGALTFKANPDGFLCEGVPRYDEQTGDLVFEPTSFSTADGKIVDRAVCRFVAKYADNNTASLALSLPPTGGLVTGDCRRDVLGPLRDCGFSESEGVRTCAPGQPVTLSCTVADAARPMVLRACEASAVLATGTACVFRDALANVTVGQGAATLEVTCPAARDAGEPGGQYQLYAAPLLPDDPPQQITCR